MSSSFRNISILGSTGSIGTNTLRVVANFRHAFRVVGLSGGKERILPLAKLSAEPPRGRHPLRFLYFQVLEGDLDLPEGFEPAQVRVRAEARGRKLYTVDRVVEWRLKEA